MGDYYFKYSCTHEIDWASSSSSIAGALRAQAALGNIAIGQKPSPAPISAADLSMLSAVSFGQPVAPIDAPAPAVRAAAAEAQQPDAVSASHNHPSTSVAMPKDMHSERSWRSYPVSPWLRFWGAFKAALR